MSLEIFFEDARTLSRLREDPLGKYLQDYAEQLHREGYARGTARKHLSRCAGFSRWVRKNGIPLKLLSTKHAEKYLRYRGRWQCRKSCDRAALNRFMILLHQNGVVEEKAICRSPIEQLTEEFVHYLRKERGLVSTSITRYRVTVIRFLSHRFGAAAEVDLSLIGAVDVIDFVRLQATCHPKSARSMTTAMRSFLHYARYQGHIQIDLASSVPTVARQSRTLIPKSLPVEQVELVLANCDRQTVMGRREYAIFLLLARLGLRAGEVVSLKLDDLDWRSGCITVRGKGGCAQLPLPTDVGEAIAAYLLDGRPHVSSRLVFLSSRAPLGGLAATTVSTLVDEALARAGINAPRRGAHQFRHTLAMEMLRQGASMAEIGELLRHRSPQSTEIYAKVDLVSLRTLALPWPGGAK